MNDGLLDAFRHNAWATRELLRACRDLSEAQLDTTVVGTYGSIIDTLRHTVRSEAGYCRRLTGEEPEWYSRTENPPSLEELAEHNDDLAARWERFLATPFDAERLFVVAWHDGRDYDVPAGVYLAQALHHSNEHRAQVCTTLTAIGVTPPTLGLWDFAEATQRVTPRSA
jgi:uncharacterized damage-inducible protein DinB